MKKTHLITIDPQNDFCTPQGPGGEKAALFVGGADADMGRLATFITKNRSRLADIHCTLDSHQMIHIAHPTAWRNSKGERPPVFSNITSQDVRNAVWSPFHPSLQAKFQSYLDTLEKNGRYPLTIWPPHCLIGTWGAAVVKEVAAAMYQWEEEFYRKVNFVPKGNNPWTEHYSAVQADVPDPSDPTTKLNASLIDTLTKADEILITGEALSHCVANTITDIANNFGDDNIKKFVFLEDTSSPVGVGPGPKMAQDFVIEMTKRGMQRTTTKDW